MKKKNYCPVCNNETNSVFGVYRKDGLCKLHANKYENGILQLKNGVFKYAELPKDEYENCILCNKKTKGYAFCKDCWRDYTEEELLDILNKKIFSVPFEDEIENSTENSLNQVITIDENNKSKCITCGLKTNGLLFCAKCNKKYKNKELLFKISNCTNVELLDDSYEGKYICNDGHIVKSKSEREIDNYLFSKGIIHAYEKEISYGANSNEVLHPDFYLPNYLGFNKDVYIEHWGYNENNYKYTETKKFKMPIYKNKGITLICTFEKTDMKNITATLERKLDKNNILENKINFDNE